MLPVPINLEERFGALLEDCADDTYDMALYFLEKQMKIYMVQLVN